MQSTKIDQKHWSVAIIGAGGLGHPAAWGIIAGLPAETRLSLRLIDHDVVERSNLNRQILFRDSDTGKPKSAVLAERLAELPEYPADRIDYKALQCRLTEESAQELLGDCDFVIDACDDVATKFCINDYCIRHDIAFCYGGVVANHGQILTVPSGESHRACLRCLFGDYSREDYDAIATTCRQAGIIGAVAGHLGFLQARAALRVLSGQLHTNSELIRFSTKDFIEKSSSLTPAIDCPLHSTTVRLDLRDKRCPETFLYTKLALEKTRSSDTLEVLLSSVESKQNVACSVKEEGYTLIGEPALLDDSSWRLCIRAGKH